MIEHINKTPSVSPQEREAWLNITPEFRQILGLHALTTEIEPDDPLAATTEVMRQNFLLDHPELVS